MLNNGIVTHHPFLIVNLNDFEARFIAKEEAIANTPATATLKQILYLKNASRPVNKKLAVRRMQKKTSLERMK